MKNSYKSAMHALITAGADINEVLFREAKNKDQDTIKILIEQGADINEALFKAAKDKDQDTIKILIEYGANKNDALLKAVIEQNRVAVYYLRQEGADGSEVLYNVASEGNKDATKFLIDCLGRQFNIDDVVIKAAEAANKIAVTLLLKHVDAKYTLYTAAEAKNEAAMKFLIECGVNPSMSLIDAGIFKNEAEMDLLIQYGADVTEALFAASSSSQYEDAVKFLIERRANKEDALFKFLMANNRGQYADIISLLINGGADVGEVLYNVASEGNKNATKFLIDRLGRQFSARDVVIKAAEENDEAAVTLLLEHVDARYTLYTAAEAKNEAAMKFLIECGVNPSMSLIDAGICKNEAEMDLLIQYGADVTEALFAASRSFQYKDAVKFLIERRANKEDALFKFLMANNRGQYADIISLLINGGADVGEVLYNVASEGNKDATKFLIDRLGRQFSARDVVIKAAEAANKIAVTLLLEHVDAKYTLYTAAEAKNEAAMKFLIECGVNPSMSLIDAGIFKKEAEMDLLIQYGADVTEALFAAASKEFGYEDAAKFLIEYGANKEDALLKAVISKDRYKSEYERAAKLLIKEGADGGKVLYELASKGNKFGTSSLIRLLGREFNINDVVIKAAEANDEAAVTLLLEYVDARNALLAAEAENVDAPIEGVDNNDGGQAAVDASIEEVDNNDDGQAAVDVSIEEGYKVLLKAVIDNDQGTISKSIKEGVDLNTALLRIVQMHAQTNNELIEEGFEGESAAIMGDSKGYTGINANAEERNAEGVVVSVDNIAAQPLGSLERYSIEGNKDVIVVEEDGSTKNSFISDGNKFYAGAFLGKLIFSPFEHWVVDKTLGRDENKPTIDYFTEQFSVDSLKESGVGILAAGLAGYSGASPFNVVIISKLTIDFTHNQFSFEFLSPEYAKSMVASTATACMAFCAMHVSGVQSNDNKFIAGVQSSAINSVVGALSHLAIEGYNKMFGEGSFGSDSEF